MTPKRYITQLTAQDMRELAAVTNLKPGWLVIIEKNGNEVKIGIDYTQFAIAMKDIYNLTPRSN